MRYPLFHPWACPGGAWGGLGPPVEKIEKAKKKRREKKKMRKEKERKGRERKGVQMSKFARNSTTILFFDIEFTNQDSFE